MYPKTYLTPSMVSYVKFATGATPVFYDLEVPERSEFVHTTFLVVSGNVAYTGAPDDRGAEVSSDLTVVVGSTITASGGDIDVTATGAITSDKSVASNATDDDTSAVFRDLCGGRAQLDNAGRRT